MGSPPSSKRTELAAELKKLRLSTGLSSTAFGEPNDWSQSKVSKTERGQTRPDPGDVRKWARFAGADKDTVARLVALAKEVEAEARSWAEEDGTFAERNKSIGEAEREMTALHNFQPSAVSGLLQTAEYARRVITLLDPDGKRDVAAAVAARMDRQTVLYDVDKQFEFLLTEGALRWQPGAPSLMLAQLDRLASIATLPNVTIGVLPYGREATMLHLNGFTIFDHPEKPFVLLETYGGEQRLNKEDEITPYRVAFSRLRDAAVTGQGAVEVIRRIMSDLADD
jgi:transcriptional regulator with XRE-family HTH domain